VIPNSENIVRGTANLNPLILKAIGHDGREVKRFRQQRLNAVKSRLSKYETASNSTPLKATEFRSS
jgi:hypothetical protein